MTTDSNNPGWHMHASFTDGSLPKGWSARLIVAHDGPMAWALATNQEAADARAKVIVRAVNSHAALVATLESLQREIRSAVKFDVKKHYSLMVADVAASKALAKAGGASEPGICAECDEEGAHAADCSLSLSDRDIEEFNGFLATATDRQIQGIYEKERDAGRLPYVALVRNAAMARNIILEG